MLSSTTINKFSSFCYIERGPRKKALIKHGHSYYLTELSLDDVCSSVGEPVSVSTVKDSPIALFPIVGLIAYSLFLYFTVVGYRLIDADFFGALAILFLNVVFHELAHIAALKAFDHNAKVKFGFKIAFPFPSFYVDTSDSYMLPTCKRIAVYLSGIAANSLFVVVALLLFPEVSSGCYLVVSMILVNLIPIMKCDGFHCALAILGKDCLQRGKGATLINELLRGLLTLVLLLAFSAASSVLGIGQ